jgi:hypothetical protein
MNVSHSGSLAKIVIVPNNHWSFTEFKARPGEVIDDYQGDPLSFVFSELS